jgi:hypothetical protein
VPDNTATRDSFVWSAGVDYIAGDHDAYGLVGLGFGLHQMVEMVGDHRAPRFYQAALGHRLASERFLFEAVRDFVDHCAAVSTLTKLRTVITAPVLLVPSPYMTRQVLIDDAHRPSWSDPAWRAWMCAQYRAQVARLNADCVVVEQPAATVEDEMFSRAEYSRDSVNFFPDRTVVHEPTDYKHMNDAFGALAIEALLKQALR